MIIIGYFIEGIKKIPLHLGKFIKKILSTVFVYAYSSILPIAFALLVHWILSLTDIPSEISSIIFKILSTIGQIIPLSVALYSSDEEFERTNNEFSDLCFAVCIAAIVWIWAL